MGFGRIVGVVVVGCCLAACVGDSARDEGAAADALIESEPLTVSTDAASPEVTPSTSAVTDSVGTTSTSAVSDSVATTSTTIIVGNDPWLRTFDEAPLADRVLELVVAMDGSVLVWGGFVPEHADGSEPPFDDGAVVDVSSGEWTTIASSPLEGGWASGVWTGSEAVVTSQGRIAAFDPVNDSWRDLALPRELPLGSSPYASQHLALVGSEVMVPFAGLAWNIQTGAWRETTPAPSVLGYPQSAVIGGRLIVAGAPDQSPTNPVAFSYSVDADEWMVLPAPGWHVYDGDAIGFVGEQIVVVSSLQADAGVLDLDTLQWSGLPAFPQRRLCHGQLEPVDETVLVVSLCSLHGALDLGGDRWTLFEPPARSRTFGLVTTSEGLVVDGALLDTTAADWLRSPLIGPLTIGGVSIDRSVEPELGPDGDGGPVRIDLRALDCALDVADGDPIDQQSVAAAQEQASSGAATVAFSNQFGSYVLSCPDAEAYVTAFDSMTIRGERGTPSELVDFFDPPLAATATPEQMVESVLQATQEGEQLLGRDSSIGLSAPFGDPPTFLVDVYYDDGPKQGETYTIALGSTAKGWVIDDVTVQSICTRTPRTDTADTCR